MVEDLLPHIVPSLAKMWGEVCVCSKLFYSFVYKMGMTNIYPYTILRGSVDRDTYVLGIISYLVV